MAANPQIDLSFTEADLWREEAVALRAVLLGCGLDEELKWGKPCYSKDGANICIIQRMKGFLVLLFFKGVLLDDPDGLLERQGPNSQSGFRMRFTAVGDVTRNRKQIAAFVSQAVAAEKAGLQVEKSDGPAPPDELLSALDADPAFKEAFEALTPGRQRGYILHFAEAKQAKTRAARIEKNRDRIFDGMGLHDR